MKANEIDPCQFLRASVLSLEDQVRNLARGLSRFDTLKDPPTPAQQLRIDELSRQKLEIERQQRTVRARLRDCEREPT